MTPETIDQLKELFAPVAEKIGEGAGAGWDVLVGGMFAEGIASLAIAAVLILVAVIVVRFLTRDETLDATEGFTYIPAGVISVVVCVICGILIYDGLIATIAPEYAALKFLINSAQGIH